MNEAIVDLGEAIISAYYNKLNEWSSLAELTFTNDDLSASFGMADDILRLEDGWQEFAALVQTLPTDYLPQDLLEASGTESLQPEQQLQPSHSGTPAKKYPSTLSATGEPFVFPTDLEEQPIQKNIANTAFPLSPSGFNFPEMEQASSSYIENKPLSFELPEHPFEAFTSDIPMGSGKETPSMLREDTLNLKQNQGNLNVGEPGVIPQGSSMQKTEPGETNDYAASIWTSPLQNLGDFASRITYPAPGGNRHISASGPNQLIENNMNLSSINARQLSSPVSNTQTNVSHSSTSNQSATSNLLFTTPSAPDTAESMSKKGEIAGLQPENQPFQSSVPPPAILPDTDELLEALTDRIRRDFRRYYP